MVSLSVRYLFYQSIDDDPLNGEKYLSLVRLETQYLFPMSSKINFQQSFFLERNYFCLFDKPVKFLYSFLFVVLFCLFVCLFFSVRI